MHFFLFSYITVRNLAKDSKAYESVLERRALQFTMLVNCLLKEDEIEESDSRLVKWIWASFWWVLLLSSKGTKGKNPFWVTLRTQLNNRETREAYLECSEHCATFPRNQTIQRVLVVTVSLLAGCEKSLWQSCPHHHHPTPLVSSKTSEVCHMISLTIPSLSQYNLRHPVKFLQYHFANDEILKIDQG